MNITIIGGGLIGSSWAALCLAHGHAVCVQDLDADIEPKVRAELRRIQPFMAQLGLALDAQTPALRFDATLATAVQDADVVQECGPERVKFKQQLWMQVEQHCPVGALLLSSSSGIPASMQAMQMKTAHRMLVGHPFNPPHLIPLVEVVPGKRTSPEATEQARSFYASMGKQAVVLNKEIPGFVANRIQAAVIRESVALLKQGVVSAQDLDVAVQSSLGVRWATGGPFLSAHLGGGAGGVKGFLKQFSGGLQLLWLHMRLRPVLLTRRTQEAIAQGVGQAYGAHTIDQLASQRDAKQIAVIQALNASDKV
jgi:ketoreductase RED1